MVKCDNCPVLPVQTWGQKPEMMYCGIIGDMCDGKCPVDICPLKRIELKDGTVFEPEEA